MPNRPPYYEQETSSSCGPACLRMVLATLGVFKTEEELRRLTRSNEEGTVPEELADAAKQLSLETRLETYFNLDKLKLELDSGHYPIVFLRVRSAPNISVHAVVVVEISESEVVVLDPDPQWQEYHYPKLVMWRQWTDERRRVILIG